MKISDASNTDLLDILEIYNEIVTNSTAVYSDIPTTLAERSTWLLTRRAAGSPVVVADRDGQVLALATFGEWRGAWAGYRYTVEHSVHVRAERRGQGIGSELIRALFPRARSLGQHVMIGGIDAENMASIRMHARLGFKKAAHFRQVGRKFDRWLDLVFMQRLLD